MALCPYFQRLLKTFHGLHIFKDFKDPWGPCNANFTNKISFFYEKKIVETQTPKSKKHTFDRLFFWGEGVHCKAYI